MIALIQRVSSASVRVGEELVGQIGPGLLALAAVERGDGLRQAERLAERIIGYRVFEDPQGRMNLSLADTGGGLLLVSQFTLAADTRKGARPSFTPAADPATGLGAVRGTGGRRSAPARARGNRALWRADADRTRQRRPGYVPAPGESGWRRRHRP
jgi:D-tyrosyl-tRNA(Tyr) deacylase